MTDDANQIEAVEAPEWGPAMRALNPRQRDFVIALFHPDAPAKSDGQNLYAAHRARYGNSDGTSNDKSLGVIAARLRNSPVVQAAIGEYFRQAICDLAPDAARELRFKVLSRKGRDQIKAISLIADRVDPPTSIHTVKVERSTEPATPEQIDRVLRRIEELGRRFGLLPPPKVIEGEVVEAS
jgi:hypothetical protein